MVMGLGLKLEKLKKTIYLAKWITLWAYSYFEIILLFRLEDFKEKLESYHKDVDQFKKKEVCLCF